MGCRFASSSAACCQMKALVIILMLAMAEGRRVSDLGNAFKSRGAFSSRGGVGSASKAPDSDTDAGLPMDADLGAPPLMDVLLEDPAFKEQLTAMAGHMDEFALSMKKAPAPLLAQAANMADEMFKFSRESSSSSDSSLPEKMEAMIADQDFQERAGVLARKMQEDAKLYRHEELEAAAANLNLNSQETSTLVSEKMANVMTDPEFQKTSGRVSEALGSLMRDPEMVEQAELLAASMESVKDSQGLEKISEQVDSMIANTKFKAKASAVVYEMLEAETKDGLESAVAEEALEAENTTHPSLLEEWSGQEEDASKPHVAKPLSAALMLLLGQGSAFQVGGSASKRRVATGSQHKIQQASEGWAPSFHALERKPNHGIQMSYLGEEEWEDMEDMVAAVQAPCKLGDEECELERAPLTMLMTSAKGIRAMLPSLEDALRFRGSDAKMGVKDADGNVEKGFPVDVPLLLCFAFWYLGNYLFNISNKRALIAAGGAAGFPMTITTLQLGVGVIFALLMWIAPGGRQLPKMTFEDYVSTLNVGAMTAGAHAASVFALAAGSVSFAQIVKAAEPAFAAAIGTLIYGAKISTVKWLSLIPVIGGVCLASLGELNFAMGALVAASLANLFGAIKGNENAKLMKSPGISERMGSIGNQFAITTINAFLVTLPFTLLFEGAKLGQFLTLMKTSPTLLRNVIVSGLWCYIYSELATRTIKKTSAVTASVANTAKRVIVIVVVALVMKESLTPLKLIGSGIGIGGVLLYSIIDELVEAERQKKLLALDTDA